MSHFNTEDISLMAMQKKTIIALLDEQRLTGEIKSDEEYNTQLEYMLGLLEAGEPMMKVRVQEGQTNANDFNETYQETSIDIMTSFTHINKLDESLTKHQQLNQSIINNLKLSLNNASDDMEKYERLVDELTSDDITVEMFRDSSSFEGSASYYTERDGTELANAYQAKWDKDKEAIKLPTIISQDAMIGPAGVRLATIKILKQLGGETIRLQNPQNDVSKAIDTSTETFWSESILVDSPIRVELTSDYYNIQHGAAVELLISFDYLTQVNEVSFLPFTEFPMEVVAVQYYESDDVDETPKEIIAPELKEGLRSRYVSESSSFQFHDVYAKRIRVLLNQIHFTKTDFVINQKEQQQRELWAAAEKEINPSDVEVNKEFFSKPLYQNKAEVNPLYTYFNQNIEDFNVENIEEIMTRTAEDLSTSVTKYMYNYGLYNLGVRRNEYQDRGIYVSEPFEIDGTVKAINLQVDEEHPVLQDSDLTFTDIEYYVTHLEEPSEDQWYPIMPTNKSRIYSELLLPKLENGQYRTPLRFKADGSVLIRKNGILLYEMLGQFTVSDSIVTIMNYDVSATYTAEYAPAKGAYLVDFLEKQTYNGIVEPNKRIEEFQGTDEAGEIALSSCPFVDRAKLNQQEYGWNPSYLFNDYLPIKVKLIQDTGFHIDQPANEEEEDTITVENRTDYFDEEDTVLYPFSEDLQNFQYIVRDNKIVFNTVIPETTKVVIEYPYLIGAIRLKAILRRNIQSYYGLTPVLNEFMVRYQRLF